MDNAIRQAELNYCHGERFSFGSFQVCHLSVPSASLEEWNIKEDRKQELENVLGEDNSLLVLASKRAAEMTSADYMNIDTKNIEVWFSALAFEASNKIFPHREAIANVLSSFQKQLDKGKNDYEAVNMEKLKYDNQLQRAREELARKSELDVLGKRRLRRAVENYEAILRPLQDELVEKKERFNKLQTLISKFIEIRERISKDNEKFRQEHSDVEEKLFNLQKELEKTQSPTGLAGFQLPFKKEELNKFREIFWLPGLHKLNQIALSEIGLKVYGENRFLNIINGAFRKASDAPIYVDFVNAGEGGSRRYPVQMVNMVSGEANDLDYLQSTFQRELGMIGSGEYGIGWYIAQAQNLGSSVYLAIEFDGIPPTQIKDFKRLEELYELLRERVPNGQCYSMASTISLINPAQLTLKEINQSVKYPSP